MKVINVGGFGNTGCTAQSDFLAEYDGVKGILADSNRNLNVLRAPYQEFGILKCQLSLGGIFIQKFLSRTDFSIKRLLFGPRIDWPSKRLLEASLKGESDTIKKRISRSEEIHLQKRALLKKEYGKQFDKIVHQTLKPLPERIDNLHERELLELIKLCMSEFINGIEQVIEAKGITDSTTGSPIDVLGLKNDPPGAYPALATVIPKGISSAILRDPRDTNFDFINNKANFFGDDIDSIKKHCHFYNRQLRLSRILVERYQDQLYECFFVHDFENFVTSKAHREKYLKRMVGERQRVREYFHPLESIENIGIYKLMPKEYLKVVEKECMNPYLKYRAFMRERGFLME